MFQSTFNHCYNYIVTKYNNVVYSYQRSYEHDETIIDHVTEHKNYLHAPVIWNKKDIFNGMANIKAAYMFTKIGVNYLIYDFLNTKEYSPAKIAFAISAADYLLNKCVYYNSEIIRVARYNLNKNSNLSTTQSDMLQLDLTFFYSLPIMCFDRPELQYGIKNILQNSLPQMKNIYKETFLTYSNFKHFVNSSVESLTVPFALAYCLNNSIDITKYGFAESDLYGLTMLLSNSAFFNINDNYPYDDKKLRPLDSPEIHKIIEDLYQKDIDRFNDLNISSRGNFKEFHIDSGQEKINIEILHPVRIKVSNVIKIMDDFNKNRSVLTCYPHDINYYKILNLNDIDCFFYNADNDRVDIITNYSKLFKDNSANDSTYCTIIYEAINRQRSENYKNNLTLLKKVFEEFQEFYLTKTSEHNTKEDIKANFFSYIDHCDESGIPYYSDKEKEWIEENIDHIVRITKNNNSYMYLRDSQVWGEISNITNNGPNVNIAPAGAFSFGTINNDAIHRHDYIAANVNNIDFTKVSGIFQDTKNKDNLILYFTDNHRMHKYHLSMPINTLKGKTEFCFISALLEQYKSGNNIIPFLDSFNKNVGKILNKAVFSSINNLDREISSVENLDDVDLVDNAVPTMLNGPSIEYGTHNSSVGVINTMM